MNHLSGFLAFLILAGPLTAQTLEERKMEIKEKESSQPSEEAKARKAKSVERLRKEGVPTIEHLPFIEDSTEAKKRTKEEIAKRAIAVAITAVKGEGLDQETIDSLVKKFGAQDFFSPAEAAFIRDPKPGQQDRIQFSWRYECLCGSARGQTPQILRTLQIHGQGREYLIEGIRESGQVTIVTHNAMVRT